MSDYKNNIDSLLDSQNSKQMHERAVQIVRTFSLDLLHDINIDNYYYCADTAVNELELDLELVEQLVEDYIVEILESIDKYLKYFKTLRDNKEKLKDKECNELRDLAHKNLGVARNLRIRDAEELLYEIMKGDDLDYMFECFEALVAATVILKPDFAYKTVLEIKKK